MSMLKCKTRRTTYTINLYEQFLPNILSTLPLYDAFNIFSVSFVLLHTQEKILSFNICWSELNNNYFNNTFIFSYIKHETKYILISP